MTKLPELQKNLKACEQRKQNVIANQNSYTKTITYTVPGRETYEKIEVPYPEVDHLFVRDPRDPGRPGNIFQAFSSPRGHEQLTQFLVGKTGNNSIRVPEQGALRFGHYILYFLNDHGQRGHIQNHWHEGVPWSGTINLYYYVRGQETRTKTEFDSVAYNSALSSAQRQIDKVQQQINAENARIAQEALKAKAREEALLKQQEALALKQKAEQEQKEITAKITSMTIEGRMDLFVETFNKKDVFSQFTIEKIKSMGLNADYLAHLAIQKNNEEFFDLSIKEGANFNSYFVEGKTLLQHAIHSQNESLIAKALAKCNNLAYTAISALDQDDELTITKLLSHDANLLKAKYTFYDSVTFNQ